MVHLVHLVHPVNPVVPFTHVIIGANRRLSSRQRKLAGQDRRAR